MGWGGGVAKCGVHGNARPCGKCAAGKPAKASSGTTVNGKKKSNKAAGQSFGAFGRRK